jgi:hypothetical protein
MIRSSGLRCFPMATVPQADSLLFFDTQPSNAAERRNFIRWRCHSCGVPENRTLARMITSWTVNNTISTTTTTGLQSLAKAVVAEDHLCQNGGGFKRATGSQASAKLGGGDDDRNWHVVVVMSRPFYACAWACCGDSRARNICALMVKGS